MLYAKVNVKAIYLSKHNATSCAKCHAMLCNSPERILHSGMPHVALSGCSRPFQMDFNTGHLQLILCQNQVYLGQCNTEVLTALGMASLAFLVCEEMRRLMSKQK